ncbi:arginase family protein [Candidatus Woesearchaeota archaeon]|nr:arginase family protein [Candidatus Woesearchaeota archaeon]
MKLIKIPAINGLGKTKGCEKAPDKIISKLKEFYLNEEGMLPVSDIEDVETEKTNVEENNERIYIKIKDSLSEAREFGFLGGDHSITYSCFKAFSESFDNMGLVMFDAHPDCVNNFKPATHEDFIKVLIEEGKLKKENLIIVGLRSWHKSEHKFLKENKIKFFSMKEIANENIHEVCESIMSVAKNFDGLYVSIDIDVVDPAFAPGTGYPEPAGMTSRELLYFLKKLKLLKNLKALDLVEINPEKDVNEMTVKLGAKILSEMV